MYRMKTRSSIPKVVVPVPKVKKPKALVLRKLSVLRDEMKLPGSGIYAFLPFENIDANKSAVYKIGMTEKQISHRIEQYRERSSI